MFYNDLMEWLREHFLYPFALSGRYVDCLQRRAVLQCGGGDKLRHAGEIDRSQEPASGKTPFAYNPHIVQSGGSYAGEIECPVGKAVQAFGQGYLPEVVALGKAVVWDSLQGLRQGYMSQALASVERPFAEGVERGGQGYRVQGDTAGKSGIAYTFHSFGDECLLYIGAVGKRLCAYLFEFVGDGGACAGGEEFAGGALYHSVTPVTAVVPLIEGIDG